MLFYNETYLHSRHKPDQYSSSISMGKLFRPSRREAFNFSHRWIDNFEVKFVKLYLWKIWKADFDDGHLNKERVIFCYRTYCRKMPQSTFIFTDAYDFPLYLDVSACIKKTVLNKPFSSQQSVSNFTPGTILLNIRLCQDSFYDVPPCIVLVWNMYYIFL